MDGVGIFAGLVAFLSAVATGSAAFAAWWTAGIARSQREQMRVAVFPQRNRIFEALETLYGQIMVRSYPIEEEIRVFRNSVRDARLFFAADIFEYFNEVYTKAHDLQYKHGEIEGAVVSRAVDLLQEEQALREWFRNEKTNAWRRFAPYIGFPRP